MKKLFFVTAIAVALLTSCSVMRESPCPQPANDSAEVRINFDKAGGKFDTRAFFDNTLEAEPWEKEIKSANVYVYDNTGSIVMHKVFSASDINSLSTSFILPQRVMGTECTFYAIANLLNYSVYETENNLLSSCREIVSNYNWGDFDHVVTGERASRGLPMSASKKVFVQPQGTPTNITLVLKRSLAKVALKVNVDEKFSARYFGGKIKINSTQVVNTVDRIDVPEKPQVPAYPLTYSVTQTSKDLSGDYGNIFYLGENPPLDEKDRIILRIKATFDQDGNFTFTDDQIPFQWDIMFNGTGNGEIRRNGYYRITAQINSIDALDNIKTLITAGEWDVPVSQPTENLH